ncbi:hypothetical protein AVEN_156794-1 [Araneus ventricosus]|uniref:Uncharacterized protein n=1 Tax=Araneus ventricosus TaxID=182803 RepID=A0A4Y2IT68_ARAVE|nr:hypothetical protein AVEN_156794-1 [Araneus ventricosus]
MSGRGCLSDESHFSFITSNGRVRYAVCQANSCSPLVQQVLQAGGAVLCFGTFHRWLCDRCVEQTMKANYLNIIAYQLHPYMAFVFLGNGLPAGLRPLSQGSVVLLLMNSANATLTRRIVIRCSTFGMSWSGSSELKRLRLWDP